MSRFNTALSIDTTPNRRHGYPLQHSAPPSPSSPLAQPPLYFDFPDDASDISPVGTSVVTPTTSYEPLPSEEKNLKMVSDHSVLASLASMPSPNLGQEGLPHNRHSFPLLPPHHPLRNKMYAAVDQQALSLEDSPPTTPKGHPIENGMMFPKFKMASPYSKTATSYTSTLAYLFRVPRRLRPLLLIAFSCFLFVVVYLNQAIHQAQHLDTIPHHQAAHMSRRLVHDESLININDRHRQAVLAQQAEAAVQSVSRPPSANSLRFESSEEEIAALIAFITSTTANALPLVDPSVPLEPATILDFDPARPSAREDLQLLVNEIHALFPVILFGKMRDPWHREVKKMLAEYQILPAPLIIDVDQRRDHLVFAAILERLLGTSELPQLLLKGETLGSYHDVLDMRDKGTFGSTLESSGLVSVRDAKKKKKGIKETERIENERILGPRPIRE